MPLSTLRRHLLPFPQQNRNHFSIFEIIHFVVKWLILTYSYKYWHSKRFMCVEIQHIVPLNYCFTHAFFCAPLFQIHQQVKIWPFRIEELSFQEHIGKNVSGLKCRFHRNSFISKIL